MKKLKQSSTTYNSSYYKVDKNNIQSFVEAKDYPYWQKIYSEFKKFHNKKLKEKKNGF